MSENGSVHDHAPFYRQVLRTEAVGNRVSFSSNVRHKEAPLQTSLEEEACHLHQIFESVMDDNTEVYNTMGCSQGILKLKTKESGTLNGLDNSFSSLGFCNFCQSCNMGSCQICNQGHPGMFVVKTSITRHKNVLSASVTNLKMLIILHLASYPKWRGWVGLIERESIAKVGS